MQDGSGRREVWGTVDGNGAYFSRAAAGGSFVFLAGGPVDASGKFADDARVAPPYHLSPSARVSAQTSYVFGEFVRALDALGSSIDEVVQVDQYIAGKEYADGYVETSRGPGFLERRRPASALLPTGPLHPAEAVVVPSAIAVRSAVSPGKEIYSPGLHGLRARTDVGGDYYVEEPPYNELVTAGAYAFPLGQGATDMETGVHPDVRVKSWTTWGDEARNETAFNIEALAGTLSAADIDLSAVLHATFYLVDLGDLYQIDRLWKSAFPDSPPARSVVPVPSLLIPREPDAKTHAENALRMEWMTEAVRGEEGTRREAISVGAPTFGHESEAMIGGDLLWTSGLVGVDGGEGAELGVDEQLEGIFEHAARLCEGGRTSIDQTLRVRAYVLSPAMAENVYAAVKRAIPEDPPCVVVAVVPGPLHVPGAALELDFVVHAPSRRG
jgi:enamine deaminase RidA (YjgF/YER057c/UK114 family)